VSGDQGSTAGRSSVELLDFPFSFWQLSPLTVQKFIEVGRERGVYLMPDQLEALHRMGILYPFLRVGRDLRRASAAIRTQDPWRFELIHSVPTQAAGLREARAEGRLHDPRREPFIARSRLRRERDGQIYHAADYLYSPHQLLHLVELRGLPYLRYPGAGRRIVGSEGLPVERMRRQGEAIHEVVIACSALEPVYYPDVVLRTHYRGDEIEEFRRWRDRHRAKEMMEWLGHDPDWFRSRAQGLLEVAGRIDSLGPWSDLVREADPQSWESLEGDPRLVVDLRIGAEILLRYHERLSRSRVRGAKALPKPGLGRRDPLAGRLKPTGKVNRVLTELGVSPHPRLIFVVEGETEELLLPRVFAYFKIRPDREFIAIENARGVDRDLSALVAFAISPQVVLEDGRKNLSLETPPTRLLAVMDAEGRYSEATRRAEEVRKLTERIMLTFPKKHRTESVWRSIEGLITIETWDRKGQSFEFAHFTDLELARAIVAVHVPKRAGGRRPSVTRMRKVVGKLRADRGRLDETLGSGSKVELAEALWPVLERKLDRATSERKLRRIAVVRAIDRAGELATEYPRAGLVIPLR
jgi:hypothetical protein